MTACSTHPVVEQKESTKELLTEDQYKEEAEPELPSWAEEYGMKDGYFIAVGVAEGDISASPIQLKRAARLDAESQLFARAPHEYREVVQNAVDGMKVNGASFQAVQTKLLRLHGVTGVMFPRDKSRCFKAARDNGEYVAFRRVCYQQAKIDLIGMNRAIERVINRYYGTNTGEKFRSLLDSEIQSVGVENIGAQPKREVVTSQPDEG